eukprot:g8911.t1
MPIDEVEPLLGHRQMRVANVNMMSAEIHSERLNWIVDVAWWRKLDFVLLSEFAYVKKRSKIARRKRLKRRVRNSVDDEESSDEEEQFVDGAAEHVDPILVKGEPTWVLRKRFDLLYINGCGIMLLSKRLREQARRIREQGQRNAIRSDIRFLALYLPDIVIAATYAPAVGADVAETEAYDSMVVRMLQEMKKRRRDKWKLRVIAGDINAHVGRSEFGDSLIHQGIGGASSTNARGRDFAKVMMATNTVLVSSKFAIEGATGDEEYFTYMGKAGRGRSEVDHYLASGAHLSKYRAYRRVDYGAPGEDGRPRARCGIFDHLAAKKKYDEVGNSPLHPGADELPADEQLRGLIDGLSDELLEEINKPISSGELKRAAAHLKQGGKAKDVNGLGADILLKLGGESLELMTAVAQKDLANRDFHNLTRGLHRCRDVSLFKGKGSSGDPDNCRYLVISPLTPKVLVRVMSERLCNALEKANFFADSQFGFRRKRGTHDSLLVFNRLREDLKHYRFSSALRAFVALIDLKKALPSLDWRLVRLGIRALGVEQTKMWEVLDATHRCAEHSFGNGIFRLEHGCKEGDPSSPLLFIMAFSVVMRYFKKKLDQRRQEKGEERPEGVPLHVKKEAWFLSREDKILQLGFGDEAGRTTDFILDFLFADDTTLLQRMEAEKAREAEQHDAEALRREMPLLELDVVSVFGGVLADCGLRENETKRVQADVVSIATRNLGMNTDAEIDWREKVRKAWKAYWALRSRLSGIGGVTNARRGELVQIMTRSILLYGLQTRFVSESEATKLQKEESKILAQALDCKWWEREMRGWTYADLRRRARVPAFKFHLKFLQARVTYKAMVGKFFPVGTDGAADLMRSEANVIELGPAARTMPDLLQDRIKHLTEDCGLTVEALQLLFETPEEANERRPELPSGQLYAKNKRIFYAATRKWFVRVVARDWARGDGPAEQRAADSLIEKYFGSKDQPNETREQLRRLAVTIDAPESPEDFAVKRYRPSPAGLEEPFYSGVCTWCGSSAGAMALHAEAHLRDDYIKNSEIYRRVKAEDGTWVKEFTGDAAEDREGALDTLQKAACRDSKEDQKGK